MYNVSGTVIEGSCVEGGASRGKNIYLRYFIYLMGLGFY